MRNLFIILSLIVLFTAINLTGQIPQTMSYQGVLTDNSGNLVADGDYSMEFNLYNVETAGSTLWTETQTVTITDGIFNVILGDVNPLALLFDEMYWLGIIIDMGTELSPRIQLTSSAYSLNSQSVNGLDNVFPSTGNVGIGTDNPTSKLEVSGALKVAAVDNLPSNTSYALFMTGNVSSNEIGKIYVGDNTGWKLHFSTRENSNDTNLMTIQDDGNVGIGTPFPTEKLEVADTIFSSIGGFKFPDGTVQETAAVSGGVGDITSVAAGMGLYGGGTTGDVSLHVQGGTGLSVGDSVRLNIPYVDGRFVNEGQANAITNGMIQDDIVSSVAGVSNDAGNIDLVAGSNMSIVADDANNTITFSSSGGTGGGDITAVNAGIGLTGGGTVGDVTLNADFSGTGAATTISRSDHNHDATYVNESQANSITSNMIVDGTVESDDITNNSIISLDLADNAVTASKILPNVVSSVDGVSNDAGNVDFIAGSNITITPDNAGNQITFSASASNLWTESGSDIYYNSGNVGIGTSSTSSPLSIFAGTSSRGLSLTHNQTTASSAFGIYVDLNRSGTGNADAYAIRSMATNDNGVWSTRGLMASADGNATGPKYGVYATAEGAGILFGMKGVANSTTTSSQYGVYGEAMGAGTGDHYGVYGRTSGGGGNHWAGYFDGNVHADTVGIGTETPSYPLSVAGTIHSSSGGFRFPDGTTQTTAATGGGDISIDSLTDARSLGYSVYLGQGSGIIDDGSDNYNTGVGTDVLHSNTNGYNNTAQGYRALYSNAQGDANTALGRSALESNTTGNFNTALGLSALFHNTIGLNNVAVGNSANFRNQEGSENTIVGVQAGYGTALHNKSGNVFLGFNAGYNETGDNKLYIENSNSSTPLIGGDFFLDEIYLNGNVGIGTSAPFNILNIQDEDISLQETDILNEQVTIEDFDAGLGLYSNAGGNYGSLVTLGEILTGSLNNKWTMYRTSSIANPANQLRFSFGSDVNYFQNPAWLTVSGNGNVGIGGALQPATKLEVEVYGTDGIHIDGDDSGDARYSIENGGGYHYMFDDDTDAHAFKIESASSRDLAFNTNGPTERMRITSTGDVGIGTSSPSANLHVSGVDGFLTTGTHGSGSIPIENAGTRLMWYPAKAAFRAGMAGFDQWNDSNIGDYSVAMGNSTTASGSRSTAFGMNTTASGDWATSSGNNTTASGNSSTSLGSSTEASGNTSVAMGSNTIASGSNSLATGSSTTASGLNSTALGAYVSTSGSGSMIIGDYSTATTLTRTVNNAFYSRFSAGYYLYSNSTSTVGAYLGSGANSWGTISDSTKKENFKSVNGEEVLNKISDFKLTSWNYIGQDPTKFRHYGPMAQDFYAAFGNDGIGTIGNDTTLSSSDFDGINFIAIHALEKRTADLNEKVKIIENLQHAVSSLKEENSELKQKLLSLEQFNKKVESILTNLQNTQKSNSTEITLSNLK